MGRGKKVGMPSKSMQKDKKAESKKKPPFGKKQMGKKCS